MKGDRMQILIDPALDSLPLCLISCKCYMCALGQVGFLTQIRQPVELFDGKLMPCLPDNIILGYDHSLL